MALTRRRRDAPDPAEPSRLWVDPIDCAGHGVCAALLAERIRLDDWGYPLLDPTPLSEDLVEPARRAVAACPTLALRLTRRGG